MIKLKTTHSVAPPAWPPVLCSSHWSQSSATVTTYKVLQHSFFCMHGWKCQPAHFVLLVVRGQLFSHFLFLTLVIKIWNIGPYSLCDRCLGDVKSQVLKQLLISFLVQSADMECCRHSLWQCDYAEAAKDRGSLPPLSPPPVPWGTWSSAATGMNNIKHTQASPQCRELGYSLTCCFHTQGPSECWELECLLTCWITHRVLQSAES